MHFALRAADTTGAQHTCNADRRDESLYLSFFPVVITLGDSVAIVRNPVVAPVVARRILID